MLRGTHLLAHMTRRVHRAEGGRIATPDQQRRAGWRTPARFEGSGMVRLRQLGPTEVFTADRHFNWAGTSPRRV